MIGRGSLAFMANDAPIIDAQVHAYERDHPRRPWRGFLHGPPEVTGDDMVAAMDEVEVDGALLVSPWTMYRFDAGYAIDVHRQHPDRFAMIKPIDPRRPDVAEVMAAWAATPGAVGARLMLIGDTETSADDVGVNAVLAAGARHDLPINLLCWGSVSVADQLARRHPDTLLVIDHLGLVQPFEPPPPHGPWADLPAVIALAGHDNIVVKVTGACTLSHRQYPYDDIWEPLARLFDAFGFDRLLWGTDWTRAVELTTYREAVDAFRLNDRLSSDERRALMGGTLARIHRWSPTPDRRQPG